jgi:CubicO group peptidase (beta-lactamase class C family)
MRAGEYWSTSPITTPVSTDGGIVSSAEDTARFLVALMHGKLLRPATLERMKGDALWSGGELTTCGIGYGWSGG